MKSQMINHEFNQVPRQTLPRSSFKRSSSVKMAFDHGKLIPWYVDEIIPGDSFKADLSVFTRLATPLFPIMDNIKLDVYGFFCPSRILWSNFEKFQGARDNPSDSIDYTLPQVDVKAMNTESIADYMGIPVNPTSRTNAQNVNALPFRMYNKIYNDWFRSQDLINSLAENVADGPDTPSDYTIQKVAKLHDYFTSSLPNPQKGDSVDLPLGTSAPITTDSTSTDALSIMAPNQGSGAWNLNAADVSGNLKLGAGGSTDYLLEADLTNATASNINALREAFQLQRILERDQRSGTRYVEILRSRFGVISPDYRLQRPEFLFHKRINMGVTPVGQTSESGTTPLGNLAGIGTGGQNGFGFNQSFVEHGYIMFMVCARADLTYQEGIDRMWTKQTRFDLFMPELQGLGEQEISNREIYYTDETNGINGTTNAGVFGYIPRYDEYRFKTSKILGRFRSNATATFDPWHLAQEFGSQPALNQTFLEENAPMSRIKATTGDPDYIFDSFINMTCARPMTLYGVPGMIDHF